MSLYTITFDDSSSDVEEEDSFILKSFIPRPPQRNAHTAQTRPTCSRQNRPKLRRQRSLTSFEVSETHQEIRNEVKTNPDFVEYVITREKKHTWKGTRLHFMLTQGSIPIFKTKVKTGLVHSNDPIRIANGPEMHFRSSSYVGTMVIAPTWQYFSLRENSEFGSELMTVQFKKQKNRPRKMEAYLLKEKQYLTSLEPTPSILGSWNLDFHGRHPVKSVKNTILIGNDDKKEYAMIIKKDENSLSIEVDRAISALSAFAMGIAVYMCKD